MIKINTKSDPRISEAFPNDPYYNLCIITSTQRLYLQQAFLSMDSDYFAQINSDTHEVDLRELKQEPLIRVIHSLYGQVLQVNSIVQLSEIYPIIVYLGIDDYINNIEQEVRGKKEVLQNIQFLQFSYRYRFLFDQVLDIHLENKLRLLEDSKNYLQLSKIEDETLNFVLSQFIARFGQTESKILNNVMENYFNRKNIKPMVYFKNYALTKLQTVWLKYHHVSALELSTPKSTPNIYSSTEEEGTVLKKVQSAPKKANQDNQAKRRKVNELQKQIHAKDTLINELMQKINGLKEQLGMNAKAELQTKSITTRSLLIDIDSEQHDMRKLKRMELSPDVEADNDTPITAENYSTHYEIIKRMAHSQINDAKRTNRAGLKNFKRL